MKKIKITVIATTFNEEIAKKYAVEGLTACTYNTVGQLFYSNGWQKPEGLCDNAWKSMQDYVMTLSHGGKNFFDGWLKDENVAIISCNDGTRPVIYKIEALNENTDVF